MYSVTVAAISAVCPSESATSRWTELVRRIRDTAFHSPLDAYWINNSELTSKGPLGPKPSLFMARTAATFQPTFPACSLGNAYTNYISTNSISFAKLYVVVHDNVLYIIFSLLTAVCGTTLKQYVFLVYFMSDLCLCTFASMRGCKGRMAMGSRSKPLA